MIKLVIILNNEGKMPMIASIKAKIITLSVFCMLIMFTSAYAYNNGPQGFNNTVSTVSEVLKNGYDDQHVVIRGRLTDYLGKDHYEFTDINGDRIEVELDDDYNWSFVSKDQLIDLYGKIDKDFFTTTIDAKGANIVNE